MSFNSFTEPSSIYIKAFVLLNSHTDPAEPLEGKAVYPRTLSTNTNTAIADTSLNRSVSSVKVSWRSPSPKADSCNLISTIGGWIESIISTNSWPIFPSLVLQSEEQCYRFGERGYLLGHFSQCLLDTISSSTGPGWPDWVRDFLG
jgi:hypothetical protein